MKALFGNLIGDEAMTQAGMEAYIRNSREAQQYAGDVQKIEDIESIGDAGACTSISNGLYILNLLYITGVLLCFSAVSYVGFHSCLGHSLIANQVSKQRFQSSTYSLGVFYTRLKALRRV